MASEIQKTGAARLSPLDAAMRPILQSSPRLKQLMPPGMNVDRFIMQVKFALMKQPQLQNCTPASLISAVLQAADLGLDPSGRLGSAYLIPFKGEVTLVPGYRGLIDLACRSGLVRSINGYVVHERDHFRVRAGYTPEHEPFIPRPGDAQQSPGPWYAVWARAKLVGGLVESEVMTKAEVMAIKARSPGAKKPGGPWDTDEEQMAVKTVLRRLLKKQPLSPVPQYEKLARALELSDAEEMGEAAPADLGPALEFETPMSLPESSEAEVEPAAKPEEAPKSKADEIKSKL